MRAILNIVLALGSLAWIVRPAPASTLAASELYTKTAHRCKTLNSDVWPRATRAVLTSSGIKIKSVQVCNGGQFSVFIIVPKYDPRAETGTYYHALYAQLAKANGWSSYALVDTLDNVIVTVVVKKQPEAAKISYEEFQ